jgi:hypothetical protein
MTKPTLVLAADYQKRDEISYIRNAHLAFVQVQKAYANKKKEGQEMDMEYKVSAIVTEEVADEWEEKFSKQLQSIKTDKFEERFKFPAPFPKEKKQYIISVAQFAQGKNKKTGEIFDKPFYFKTRPKLYVKSEEGEVSEKTMDVLVQNGSFGDVAFTFGKNPHGNFGYLKDVLVTNLIEYEASDNQSVFGTTVGGSSYVEPEKPTEPEPTKESQKVTTKQVEPDPTVDFDDDIPF